jgi:hypothetical protein
VTYKLLLLAVPLAFDAVAAAQAVDARQAVIAVERIWDRAAHNAFTDLVEFRGRLYCTFREGSGHVPGLNGTVRVLASRDGQNWRSIALLDEAYVDLRDPKLSVTPAGRLMVLMGGSFYQGRTVLKREPRVAFSDAKGETFSPPRPVVIDPKVRTSNDWLWRVTWHKGSGWGVVYQVGPPKHELRLVTTKDGVHYDHVTTFALTGKPNETTLRLLGDGRMVALVRREGGNRSGLIGTASPPFTEWAWTELGHRLGGPNFVELPDGSLLAGTRSYGKVTKTVLARITTAGGFETLLALPSAGDTSYPGLVVRGDRLLVSYYASHEGRTSIYLATVRLNELR